MALRVGKRHKERVQVTLWRGTCQWHVSVELLRSFRRPEVAGGVDLTALGQPRKKRGSREGREQT